MVQDEEWPGLCGWRDVYMVGDLEIFVERVFVGEKEFLGEEVCPGTGHRG